MMTQSGCNIVHAAGLSWEEVAGIEGKKTRAKTYWHDAEHNMSMRLIEQTANAAASSAPVGSHASVVLKGGALADGSALHALDVILGPGNEPRSSGCQLFSCYQGSLNHTHAEAHRVIQSGQLTWDAKAGGALHMKLLLTEGAGRLMLTAMRLSAGFTVPVGSRPHMQAALVVEGSAVVGNETLRAGDFMYMASGVPHGPISFPDGATLLMVAMRAA